MAERESKYAAQLRELGCKPYKDVMAEDHPDITFVTGEGTVIDRGMPITRKERRMLVAKGLLPYFFVSPDIHSPTKKPLHIVLTLENGEFWKGPLEIEATLLKLGFMKRKVTVTFPDQPVLH